MNASGQLAAVVPILEQQEREAEARVEELKAELERAESNLVHARAAKEHIAHLVMPSESDASAVTVEVVGRGPVATSKGDSRAQWALPALDGPVGFLEALQEIVATMTAPPEGMEAVRIALENAPQPLTLAQLTDAVHALGWTPDTDDQERAVRAAASRLRSKDENFEYSNKRWRYGLKHDALAAPRARTLVNGNGGEP